MSTIQRHTAGTMIAGQQAGGQFKAQERGVAAPPSTPHIYVSDGATAAITAAREKAAALEQDAARARSAAQTELSRAMAILARDAHPDAHTVQLCRGYDEDSWSFSAVLNSEMGELSLSQATEYEMDNLISAAGWGSGDLEVEDSEDFQEVANFVIDDLWEEHEVAPVAPDATAPAYPTQLHPQLNSYIETVLGDEADFSVYALDGITSTPSSDDYSEDDYSDAVVIVDGLNGMRTVKFTRNPDGELSHYNIG